MLTREYPSEQTYRQEKARANRNVADLLVADSRPSEAARYFARAAQIREKLATDFPAEPVYQRHEAADVHSMALAL